MQPIPYLFFPGTARAAFALYGEVFGTAPEITEMGDHMPGVDPKTVMHAAVKVGDGWIYGSDDPSGTDVATMAGCNVHVSFATVEEARRVFDALSEGGKVRMPLEATFWAPAFAAFSDRFGIRWMVSADPAE